MYFFSLSFWVENNFLTLTFGICRLLLVLTATGFCLTTDAQSFLTYLKLGFVYATTGRNVTEKRLLVSY